MHAAGERERERLLIYRYVQEAEAVALAGLKRIFVVPHRQRQKRRRSKKKKKKLMMMMNIWQKIIFPVRRLCLALSTRLNHDRNKGAGLVKLRDDVQTCEYEDVQVMWEMLQKTTDHQTQIIDDKDHHHHHHHKRKQLPFRRVFLWSNNATHTK